MKDHQKAFPLKGSITEYINEGMDLRDYFAAHAGADDLVPYLKEIGNEINKGKDFIDSIDFSSIYENPKYRCQARYMFADDMMEARK